DAADHGRCFDQRRVVFLNVLVGIDDVARSGRADRQAPGRVVAELHRLFDRLDVDEQVDVALAFARLDDEVGPAGEGASPGAALLERLYRLINGCRLYILNILQIPLLAFPLRSGATKRLEPGNPPRKHQAAGAG